MQINAFADKRMKILYMLSFISGGMAQVWAANETSVTLANMSMFNTLGLLMSGKKTFGDQTGKVWHVPSCMHSK